MSLRRRLYGAALLAILVSGGGTAMYMVVEGLGLLDAFYYTVITISTVGYGEPPGGFSQTGQAATIVLVVVGVGTVFYAATTGLEYAVEEVLGGTLQARRRQRRIAKMNQHIIICGYGRIGRYVHDFLTSGDDVVVVVETDEHIAQTARDAGLAVVVGDATDDRVLEEAGIDRAAVLIASVEADPDNVAIALSARALRPDLRILARANDPQTERKLVLAGADRVVTPAVVGAARLASMAEQAELADFVDIRFRGDLLELQIEECRLEEGSALVGQTLANSGIREGSGALVVAIVSASGDRIVNPGPQHTLAPGQTIVAIGTTDHLIKLRELTS